MICIDVAESPIERHKKTKAFLFRQEKKLHANTELPKKRTKKCPLTKEDKRHNRRIASERVINENIIGKLKRFKIIADKYRNRRKRFGLRFNLIAGLYNWDLKS